MQSSSSTSLIQVFLDTARGALGKKFVVTFLTASALFVAGVAPASAEPIKWRLAYHLVKVDSSEVGDVAGHVILLARGGGMAFFDTGEVSGTTLSITADYTNGTGEHDAHVLHTFEDGSSFVVRFRGSTTPVPAQKTSAFKGKFTLGQGTGRYSGISGGGDYTGKRLAAAVATGAGIYMDFSGNYSR